MERDQWDCDFEAFAGNLQFAGLVARDPQRRRDFLAKFSREIVLISLYLNDLTVTGGSNEFHASPPENCDFCNQPISSFGFFVDGMASDGSWANMCPNCYAGKGAGIGWGIGQLYKVREGNAWQCVAGGQPSGPEDKNS